MGIRRCLYFVALACMVWQPVKAADQTLHLLIEQALELNPGLQALNARLHVAQAGQREARAAYFPQLGASINYTRTDNAPQAFMLQLNQRQLNMADPAFDPNNPDDTTNIQTALGARYALYDGTRRPQQKAATLHNQLAQQNRHTARNALIHAVTQGYYQVLEAQAFAEVQEAAQNSMAESLRVAAERHASGAAVRTDVLNLEVQQAQANENLIRARNGVQLAIAALNATIGANVVATDGLPPPPADIEPSDMRTISIQQRSELVAAHLQHQIAKQQIRMARALQHPSLQAFGSIIWDGEQVADREESYIAGVALEWNWFDGGRTRARTAAARAAQDAATANIQETILGLELESKQATLRLQEAGERIQVTQRAVTSAEEALRITRALYQEGATEVATLLVAEVALTETRMRATAARYDYHIAQSNIKRVAGLLSRPFEIQE